MKKRPYQINLIIIKKLESEYILVTGAAGFIGFHLCKKLLKEGFNVIGIDNLNTYYDVDLKKSRLKLLDFI